MADNLTRFCGFLLWCCGELRPSVTFIQRELISCALNVQLRATFNTSPSGGPRRPFLWLGIKKAYARKGCAMQTKMFRKYPSAMTSMLSLVLMGTSLSLAAPMPATSTSRLVAPQLGVFRSPLGFEINAGGTGWIHGQAPSDSQYIQTVYRAPKDATESKPAASLTVRVDKLDKPVAMEKYIQRWKKEYPKYGFDVLGSKPFTENKTKGYVLDLLNRDSNKQVRQVVFLKDTNAIILTCRDEAKTFPDSLKGCNQIIRTFNWTE